VVVPGTDPTPLSDLLHPREVPSLIPVSNASVTSTRICSTVIVTADRRDSHDRGSREPDGAGLVDPF
jgi:hypothetical protein